MKRLLDFIAALLGLIALALPLLLLMALIRRRLGSPVFFRQTRPGLHGQPFEMVKFRTMTDACGPDGALLPDAERLTPFGRFLRSTSLDELPELWNVLKGDMCLVAHLLREKWVEDYAAAARLVKQQHPQARFILLGGLDENPGSITQAEVQTWVDEGVLEWPGHSAVPPWLAQTSVFVLPSYREGVPASTQEAMAMGRAIITTDVPGCRETVVDGDNGFLVPVRDPQALAQAMLRFINQPELIARMGVRSRQMAEEKFDVHKVNARLLQEMGLS